MVKMVDEELKMDVNEDIRAANMTANIMPLTPLGSKLFTNFTKAMFVQPDLKRKVRMESWRTCDTFVDLLKFKECQ